MERASPWAHRLVDLFLFPCLVLDKTHPSSRDTTSARSNRINRGPSHPLCVIYFLFLFTSHFALFGQRLSTQKLPRGGTFPPPSLLSLTLCAYSPTIRSSSQAPPRSPLEVASMYLRLPSCSSRRAPPSHRSGLPFSSGHHCPPVVESGRWFTRLQNGYDDGLYRIVVAPVGGIRECSQGSIGALMGCNVDMADLTENKNSTATTSFVPCFLNKLVPQGTEVRHKNIRS